MRPQPRRISPSRSLAGGGRHSKHSPGSARDPMMAAETEGPTPICRCRVLYLGSSVPHITKDGLQGIQEPLKELYPEADLAMRIGEILEIIALVIYILC